MKKLELKKEKIAQLSKEESASIVGGGTNNSTNNGFTCCWCTSDNDHTQQAARPECDDGGTHPYSQVC